MNVTVWLVIAILVAMCWAKRGKKMKETATTAATTNDNISAFEATTVLMAPTLVRRTWARNSLKKKNSHVKETTTENWMTTGKQRAKEAINHHHKRKNVSGFPYKRLSHRKITTPSIKEPTIGKSTSSTKATAASQNPNYLNTFPPQTSTEEKSNTEESTGRPSTTAELPASFTKTTLPSPVLDISVRPAITTTTSLPYESSININRNSNNNTLQVGSKRDSTTTTTSLPTNTTTLGENTTVIPFTTTTSLPTYATILDETTTMMPVVTPTASLPFNVININLNSNNNTLQVGSKSGSRNETTTKGAILRNRTSHEKGNYKKNARHKRDYTQTMKGPSKKLKRSTFYGEFLPSDLFRYRRKKHGRRTGRLLKKKKKITSRTINPASFVDSYMKLEISKDRDGSYNCDAETSASIGSGQLGTLGGSSVLSNDKTNSLLCKSKSYRIEKDKEGFKRDGVEGKAMWTNEDDVEKMLDMNLKDLLMGSFGETAVGVESPGKSAIAVETQDGDEGTSFQSKSKIDGGGMHTGGKAWAAAVIGTDKKLGFKSKTSESTKMSKRDQRLHGRLNGASVKTFLTQSKESDFEIDFD